MNDAELNNRRVTIHLGLPRTATTAIQRYLIANAAGLAPDLTVLTPDRGSAQNRVAQAAVGYSLAPGAETESALVTAIQELRALVAAAPGDCLISHENLLGAAPGRDSERGLFPAAATIIALIDRHFAPMQVSYVVYTREIEAWKRGVHGQLARTERYTGSLEDFLAETQAIDGWDDLRHRMSAAVGGRAHFVDLEASQEEGAAVDALLRLAGVEPESTTAPERKKKPTEAELLASSVEFIRKLNATKLSPADRRLVTRLVHRNQALFSDSFEPSAPER